MLNMADKVDSDDTLPAKVDVVVIGGGIIGSAAAYYLARKGKKVALIEKGLIAAEQSSRNWGWCRQGGRALPEVPLAKHSLRLWEGLDNALQHPTGFHQPGVLLVTKDAKEVAAWEAWIANTKAYDMQCSILTGEEVRKKTPGCTIDYLAGLYSPVDGLAEPTMAAPSMAKAARDLGAVILQGCAVRGMETRAGAVSAVVTERGTIQTDAVLCAGGAWSSMFCAHHGISLPQAGVIASACRTTPVGGVIRDTGAVGSDGFSFRARADGGYTLAMRGRGRVELTPQGLRYARFFFPLFAKRGKSLSLGVGKSFFQGPESLRAWKNDRISPFEKIRVLDPTPDMRLLRDAFEKFQHAYPVLTDARIAQAWGGLIDSMPDAVPVISPVEQLPGFYLATGFSGHGFALGPAAGYLAAELVLGVKPVIDPHPFRYSRFFDGGKHEATVWV